ncbi:MAG: iron-containing alcohol dehydrogenase [Trueperaceae bacterium]|nr:iron-containing alcohol dehydrogenase [Trueperaceae bacterium]
MPSTTRDSPASSSSRAHPSPRPAATSTSSPRRWASRLVGVFSGTRPHAPVPALNEATAYATEVGADAVLSVGGGAVHDTAKAVALMAATGRDIRDLANRFEPPDTFIAPTIEVEPLPVLTMPSTFSAADVVGGGAFTDADSGLKHIFVHPMLTPRIVVLDGDFAATTPDAILRPSAMNAVHHCVEAIASKGHQPVTDAFALRALRLLATAAPRLATVDGDARSDVIQVALEAAALSGMTYGNSWLGLGHAICHSLGGRYGLSHAEANSVIMPMTMRFNATEAADRLALVAQGLGASFPEGSDAAAAAFAIAFVEHLARTLGLPGTLSEIGLPEGQEEAIATDAMADPQTFWNPREVTREDVIGIVRRAYR